MSAPPSTPENGVKVVSKFRRPPKRLPLSCLPCRQHKLRCDRQVPCGTCTRYRREEVCIAHPAPPRGKQRHRDPTAAPEGSLRTSGLESSSSITAVDSVRLRHNITASTANVIHRDEQLVDNVHMVSAAQAMNFSLATQLGSLPSSLGNSSPESQGLSVLFPQVLPLLQLPTAAPDALVLLSAVSHTDQGLHWKKLLVNLLPTRTQSDILLGYFIEHINWLFQTVHIPSFRKEYAQLWDGKVEDVNLIWLSLLFTILSLSALYIPVNAVEFVGLQGDTIRRLAHLWHNASQQALHAGDYESKPTLTQLQVYSISELYWYATNNIEILNSRMAQAVRHAQILGLDKDHTASGNVEEEMRHRIWWDLVDSDTFVSVCLERPPLIQVRHTKVPLPLNCNDIDLGPDYAHPKPMEEPTVMSMNISRAKIFQIINNALVTDPLQFRSYEAIVELDGQLLDVMGKLPWYSQLDESGNAKQFPMSYDFLTWQHHILRTCVSTQRIRMFRPFLVSHKVEAWNNCIHAVEDALAVYRSLRAAKSLGLQQKFFVQAYQIFSVGVTLAAMLLVERSMPNFERFRHDIETMAADLGLLEAQACAVPLTVNGRKVLLRMLALLEQGYSPEDAEHLVPEISIIIGGENTTRAYLGRHPDQPGGGQGTEGNDVPRPHEQSPGPQEGVNESLPLVANSTVDSVIQGEGGDISVGPLLDQNDIVFDFDEFQFSDSFDLFSWDMTGLLSEAVASNKLRTDQGIDPAMLV